MNNNIYTSLPVGVPTIRGREAQNIGTESMDVPQVRPVAVNNIFQTQARWTWNDTEGDGEVDERQPGGHDVHSDDHSEGTTMPTMFEQPRFAISRGQTTVATHFS